MARDSIPLSPQGPIASPPGAVEIFLSGDIDVSNASLVLDQVRQALATEPDAVILDASGVTFMSSSGVSALLASDRWCKDAAVPLVLRAPSRQVIRLLQLTATMALFDVRP
jgi:anti-sigma B factor antagonist